MRMRNKLTTGRIIMISLRMRLQFVVTIEIKRFRDCNTTVNYFDVNETKAYRTMKDTRHCSKITNITLDDGGEEKKGKRKKNERNTNNHR